MGWLSSIFKSKKPESEAASLSKETNLSDLINIVEKKISDKNSSFEPEIKGMHEKLLESYREFSDSMKTLSDAPGPEKIDESVMNVAKSFRSSLVKAFNAASIELEKPVSYSATEFGEYFKRCSSSLSQAEANVVKFVQPLKEVFPNEMRRLMKNSEKLDAKLAETGIKMEKIFSETRPLSDVLFLANDLKSSLEKIGDMNLQISQTKSEITSLEDKKVEFEQKVSEFLVGEKWAQHQARLAELSAAERKKDEIRTFVLHTIVPLDRAMKKIKKIHSDLDEKLEDEEMYDLYINDPVEAFVKDDGQQVIKKVVAKIKDIYEKAPQESDKKDKKIIELISSLESGELLRKAREDYEMLGEAVKKIESEIDVLGAKETKNGLDSELKKIVNEMPNAKSELEKLESLNLKIVQKKSEILEHLKAAAQKALGEEIRIQLA